MKKLGLFLVFSAVLFLAGCSNVLKEEKAELIEKAELNATTENSDFVSVGIAFPEGTDLVVDGNEIKFQIPEGFLVVGVDDKGDYYETRGPVGGSITCTCHEGSGCDPIKNGDDVGCLIKAGCTSCSRSDINLSGIAQPLKNIVILNEDEREIFISTFDQIAERAIIPGEFLEYKAIKDVLSELISNMPSDVSDERMITFINLYGYIFPIEVSANDDNVSLRLTGLPGGGGEITCTCNVPGDCPKEKHWSGVVWCNSDNCTSCTMSGLVTDKNGVSKEIRITGGKIVLENS